MEPNIKPVPELEPEIINIVDGHDRVSRVLSGIIATLLVGLIGVFVVSAREIIIHVEENAEQIKAVQSDLIALNHSVGSKTAENTIYLKTIILRPSISPKLARAIAKAIHRNCLIYKRDPDFVLALIEIESNFNPKAISSVGAEGLMQVMPHWKEQLAIAGDLKNPEVNIKYGIQIFGFYDTMYKDVETALMAYNRGPRNVDNDLMRGADPSRNGYADKFMKVYNRLKALNVEGD